MALARSKTLGFQPCWVACFQKLTKSGGIMRPVKISAPEFLKLLMIEVKSSFGSWYLPPSTSL